MLSGTALHSNSSQRCRAIVRQANSSARDRTSPGIPPNKQRAIIKGQKPSKSNSLSRGPKLYEQLKRDRKESKRSLQEQGVRPEGDDERLGRAMNHEKGSSVTQALLSDDEVAASTPYESDTDVGEVSSQWQTTEQSPSKAELEERQRVVLPHITQEAELQAEQPGFLASLLEEKGAFYPLHRQFKKQNSYVSNRMLLRMKTWKGVLFLFRDMRHRCDEVAIATTQHRLAKLIVRQKPSLAEVRQTDGYALLGKALRKYFHKMQPRGQANVLWGLAAMREDGHDGLFKYCLGIVEEQKIGSIWNYQEISNVAWAIAVMKQRQPLLLQQIAEEVVARNLLGFAPQAISNLGWALSTMDFGLEDGGQPSKGLKFLRLRFYNMLADAAAEDSESYESQALTNLIWSMGSAGVFHKPLCKAVSREIVRRCQSFTTQEITISLIGLAKLGYVDGAMIEAIEAEFKASRARRFPSMKHQVLANVLWSLATLRWYSPWLLDAFGEEAVARLDGLDDREVANITWSFAKLGHHPGQPWLLAVDTYALKNVASLSAQATSNILWALAVLQATHLKSFQKLMDHLGTMNVQDVDVVQLHQLFQALLLATIERKHSPQSQQLLLPQDVVSLITRVWKRLANYSMVSAFQKDVSVRLQHLGIRHKEEYMAEEGLFSIDIAFSGPNYTRVAMEVDGPFHFTANTLQPMGSTLLRHRLLRALGWTVVSIPFFEYNKQTRPIHKYQYIAEKLLRVGIKLHPDRIKEAVATSKAREHLEPSQYSDGSLTSLAEAPEKLLGSDEDRNLQEQLPIDINQ